MVSTTLKFNNIVGPSNILIHNPCYYMASSTSGQDEPNCALWLATQAGKMEPSCLLGTTHCIPHEKFPRKPYNKSFIDQVCSVKMVGYWPCSFFASLWTSTFSQSTNTQKKNLANIQPSWPHTWSITHTCGLYIAKPETLAWWAICLVFRLFCAILWVLTKTTGCLTKATSCHYRASWCTEIGSVVFLLNG